MLFFAMGGGVVVSESGGVVQSRYGFMVWGGVFVSPSVLRIC